MEIWHYWIIFGILLMIFEIFTPGFLLAALGVGAFAGSILSYMNVEFKYQLLTFSIVTLVVFFTIRPLYKKLFSKFGDQRETGVEALLGKNCKVTEKVINIENKGRVQIGGESWKALSENSQDIEEGEIVVVRRIEGATAYVEKTNSPPVSSSGEI